MKKQARRFLLKILILALITSQFLVPIQAQQPIETFPKTPNQPATCPTSPIKFGQTISGNLSSSDCQAISGVSVDAYEFSVSAGQQVSITLTSTAFIPSLLLFGPNGDLFGVDENPFFRNTARIPSGNGLLSLPLSGNYIIWVTTFLPTSGSYSVSLNGSGGGGSEFSMSVSPGKGKWHRGKTYSVTLSINRSGGFMDEIRLTYSTPVAGLFTKVTASQNPVLGTTTLLTFQVSNNAPIGKTTVSIQGESSSGYKQSVSLTLKIKP